MKTRRFRNALVASTFISISFSAVHAAEVNAIVTGLWTDGATWSDDNPSSAGNNYTIDGTPGKEAGFNDDPDGDGVPNGLEWIHGGEPLDGQSGGLEFIFTGFDQNEVYAARKGPWKLHTHLYSQTGNSWGFAANSTSRVTLANPLLFQVENDPSERYDLRAQNPAVAAKLQAVIADFNASHAAEGTFWD